MPNLTNSHSANDLFSGRPKLVPNENRHSEQSCCKMEKPWNFKDDVLKFILHSSLCLIGCVTYTLTHKPDHFYLFNSLTAHHSDNPNFVQLK